jgi:hypothetical protein
MPLERYRADAPPHGPTRISAIIAAWHGNPDKRLAIQRGIPPSTVTLADLSAAIGMVEAYSLARPSLTEARDRPI